MVFKSNKKIVFLLVLMLLATKISVAQIITANFQKTSIKKITLNYLLQLPENQKEKFPLILFLHGSGERGSNIEMVKVHSPFSYSNLIKEPIAILAPQCPEGIWWNTQDVYELLQEVTKKYNIDSTRIYLTGLSMGGWGTWKMAFEHPDTFAAVAPVCAPTDAEMIFEACKLKNIPIQIFHGALDDIVIPEQSIHLYQALKKCNAKAELTIFPNDNHNSWDSTYSNPKFYQWLLEQHR